MILHLFIIIAVITLMYYRTLNYTYIIDDLEIVKQRKDVPIGNIRLLWHHLRGKTITNNKIAHGLSILVHLSVCILIYFVFGRNNVSFITALLFGLNPVNNQASIWLSGRPYAIATLLLLVGLLFYPVMPVLYAACMWITMSGILFPILYLFHQPHLYLLILPLIAYLFRKRYVNTIKSRILTETDIMTQISPKKIILLCKTLGYYFRLCLFPLRLGMCHNYLHSFGLTPKETETWWKLDKYFWLGVGLLLLGIVALFNYQNPVAYGLLWFLILTVQWCNVFMVNHPITERYIYLPLIGLMYALANLVVGTPFIWIFLTFYAVRLFYFMPAYKDIIQYWKSNTENFPTVAMGYNQYGLGLINFGNTGSAIDIWVRGIQERPHDFRLSYNLSNVLMACGQTAPALHFLKIAEANLEKRNNYDFWIGEIGKIKDVARSRGVEVN